MNTVPPLLLSLRHPRRRRGTVLIVAIGVLAILTAIVLTLARSMRVEAMTSANYTATVQAEAVEQAAEQYAMELLVNNTSTPVLSMDYTNFMSVPVGDAGYFWVIRPNYDDPMLQSYGFIDENAKLNINYATEDQLMQLPGMTTDLADAIVDWHDDDDTPSESGAGAESDYYQSLPNPYQAKNAPFESVEELLLVRGFTRDLLYGQQMADNGRFIPYDQTGTFTGDTTLGGGDVDPTQYRGLFDYLTVYSVSADSSTATGGGGGNSSGSGGGSSSGGGGTQGGGNTRSQVAAGGSGGSSGGGRGGSTGGATGGSGGTAGGTNGGGASGAAAATQNGRININTAPREVLRCLPNITEQDVDAIISQRSSSVGSDPTDTTWFQTAVPSASQLQNYITGQSFQFSADIVAVSANGRSFKRVRVIFDIRSTTPKIIYRRDLTEFGWPLDPQILASLRHGTGIPGGGTTATTPGSSRRTM